jgi:hypothetical protein
MLYINRASLEVCSLNYRAVRAIAEVSKPYSRFVNDRYSGRMVSVLTGKSISVIVPYVR